MKTVDYPCEHGYYGLCTQCVREERNELRARVAELEARIAELQPMAKCAAIMAFCGYFSRMRRPVAMVLNDVHPFSSVYKVEWYTNYRDLPDGTKLYAGSAPVPAAQASDYWLDGNVIRKGKEYVAEIIGQDPLLLRELLTGKAAAQAVDAGTALSVLSKAMQDDADFAWAWHCNIAMTAQDAGAPHDLANVWAANFMRRAFDVDTLSRVISMLAAKAKGGGK